MTSVGVDANAVEIRTWLMNVSSLCGIARRFLCPAECLAKSLFPSASLSVRPVHDINCDRRVNSSGMLHHNFADVSKERSTFETSQKTWEMSNTAVISLEWEILQVCCTYFCTIWYSKMFRHVRVLVQIWLRIPFYPCQSHATIAPYLCFIRLPSNLHKLSNWQHR